MKAFLVFGEGEPVLIMSSRAAADDGRLVGGLTDRGFSKFIAYEVPLDRLRERYGVPFEVIEHDVRHGKEVRVLDYKGSHVLNNVRFAELGSCICHESTSAA
jgi:hypothetical protein